MSLFANQSPNQGGGGLFGGHGDQNSYQGGGLFGNQSSHQGGGLFGNQSSSRGGGLFGNQSASRVGGLFGNQSSSRGGGLFGGNQVQQEQSPSSHSQDLFSDMCSVGSCLNHRNKPLDLFCKTDKIKICVNCAYSECHKGHDIDLIENMKSNMPEKGILYEQSLKKVNDSRNLIFSIIDEKAQPFDQILKERQRNEEITRLKAWFLIRNYIYSQKVNFGKTLEKKSLSDRELREAAQDYQKGNDSGLAKTAAETLEEIKVKFDESVFEGLCVENKESIQEQTENLKNELNEIYNQESGDVLKLECNFLIKKNKKHLELEAKVMQESFELKLNELKEVSSLSIIVEKAWFYEQDLNLLKLILLNLPSLDSLSLYLKASPPHQAPSLIHGCNIFTHIHQSFQLATNLSLHKLKHFALVSESKILKEHDQVSEMMLGLTSTMNSLKLLKIHFNHVFEDPIQKEWRELRELKKWRELQESKPLSQLRELAEQNELKGICQMIEKKELEVSKKSGINCTLRIKNILENNKNLENAEFIIPNVDLLDPSLVSRGFGDLHLQIPKLLIKAKNLDLSIPEKKKESVPEGMLGQPNAQQINSPGTGVGVGGGLFGGAKPTASTVPTVPTEHSERAGCLFVQAKALQANSSGAGVGGGVVLGAPKLTTSTVPTVPTEYSGTGGRGLFASKPTGLTEQSGIAKGIFGSELFLHIGQPERGRGGMFGPRSATPTEHSGRREEGSFGSRSATPTEHFERERGVTFGSRPTTPTERSGKGEGGNIFQARSATQTDNPGRSQQQGEKKVSFSQGTKMKN